MQRVLVVVFGCCVAVLGASAALAQSSDKIYHNGPILTMAGDKPTYVEALVVNDGKILFVGDKNRALAMKGGSTRVIYFVGE